MKNISKILAGLPLVVSGCGGGGSGDPGGGDTQTLDISQYKGTWANDSVQTFTTASGNTTTFGSSQGLASSNKRLAYVTGDFKAIFVEPDTNIGHYFSAYTYIDSVEISITQSGNDLDVSFNNPQREIFGTISLTQSSDYSSSVSLVDLAGTWIDDDTDNYYYPGNGFWTFVVQNDGSFTASSVGNCSATGSFATIDASANEFNVSMTVTLCNNSAFNGSYSGIAYKTENNLAEETMVIMATNGTSNSSRALVIKPAKQ